MALSEWLDRWLEQMASILQSSTLDHCLSDMEHHIKPTAYRQYRYCGSDDPCMG